MISILVTGADGFIGQNLVKRIIDMNYNQGFFDLVCVDKDPKLERSWKLDVAEKDFLYHLRDYNFDFIFHFGSPCSILQFNKNPGQCVDNTLSGFRNILKLAERCKARLIYPSSGNVYGSSDKTFNESDKPHPTNIYGICKAWCENMAKSPGVDSVGLRIFCGYGPGEEMKGSLASVLYLFLSKMMKGESPVIWGDGNQMRDFVYIDDIVEGILLSMSFKRVPFMNIASGVSFNYTTLVYLINEVLGTDIKPLYVDKPENYVEKTFADITLMRYALGVKPRTLRVGIKQFSKYLSRIHI